MPMQLPGLLRLAPRVALCLACPVLLLEEVLMRGISWEGGLDLLVLISWNSVETVRN